jgi:hypothetical protein
LVKQAQSTHRSAKESIKLTASNRNELEYIVKSVVVDKGTANRVKLNQLDVSPYRMIGTASSKPRLEATGPESTSPDTRILTFLPWRRYVVTEK